MTTSTASLVTSLRTAYADLRAFTSPAARAQRSGRNSDATASCLAAKEQRVELAIAALLELGDEGKRLVGQLTDEDGLAGRVAEARRLGQARPELKARLATVRREVRAAVAA